MINAELGTPMFHGFGNQFSVVGDQALQVMPSLIFDGAVPLLQNGSCVCFGAQW